MKLNRLVLFTMALLLSFGGRWTYAQEGDDGALDITMTLMPADADLPDAVTQELALPRDAQGEHRASEEGVTHSAEGLETANEARTDGGLAVAQDAAAEAAANDRADFGRGTLSDELPNQMPADVPTDLPEGRPDDLPL
jgi:hypothetical protein